MNPRQWRADAAVLLEHADTRRADVERLIQGLWGQNQIGRDVRPIEGTSDSELVITSIPEMPAMLSHLIAESLNACRYALDHCVFGLVSARHAKFPAETIAFPITRDEDKLKRAMLWQWLTPGVAKAIQALKPWHQEGGNVHLSRLAKLTNIAKHRRLILGGLGVSVDIAQQWPDDLPAGFREAFASAPPLFLRMAAARPLEAGQSVYRGPINPNAVPDVRLSVALFEPDCRVINEPVTQVVPEIIAECQRAIDVMVPEDIRA